MTGRANILASVLLAFMTLFLLYSIFGEDGLVDYFRLRDKGRALANANETIGLQNLELYRVIERLSGDLAYIETMARRELGMVAPEEYVFKFESSRVPPRVIPDNAAADEQRDHTP